MSEEVCGCREGRGCGRGLDCVRAALMKTERLVTLDLQHKSFEIWKCLQKNQACYHLSLTRDLLV